MTAPGVIVETTTGRVEGTIRRGTRRFRGIPFALPPTGERRFLPPQPHPGWAGVRSATTFGAQPVQQSQEWRTAPWRRGAQQSEDCLFLNVTAPRPTPDPAPVMVWLHPGAFINGAASDRAYDATALVRNGGVIVVTLNYRLGSLGWLHLEHLDPDLAGSGNLGLQDQIAALRWVRDNIAAFGGDPEQVTLFGESAGAMSIAALLSTPEHHDLFHRAVLQSGAAHYMIPEEDAAELADRVMAAAGVSDLAELRNIDAMDLMAAQAHAALAWNIQKRGPRIDQFLSWGPVLDGRVLAECPLDAIAGGVARGIPLIVGSNREEWNILDLEPAPTEAELQQWMECLLGDRAQEVLAVYRASGLHTPVEIKRAVQTDRFFSVPAIRLADAQAAHRPEDTYLYRFEWTRRRSDRGATHASEQPFVFGHPWPWELGQGIYLTGPFPPRRLVNQMNRSWLSFVNHGSPAHRELPTWQPWTEDQSRMRFGTPSELITGPLDERLTVWRDIL
jgi:para-nitrobenzyl esterase